MFLFLGECEELGAWGGKVGGGRQEEGGPQASKGKICAFGSPPCLWLGSVAAPCRNPCPDVVPVLNLSLLCPTKGQLDGSWLSYDI